MRGFFAVLRMTTEKGGDAKGARGAESACGGRGDGAGGAGTGREPGCALPGGFPGADRRGAALGCAGWRVAVCHPVRRLVASPLPIAQSGCVLTDRKSTRLNSSHRCISYAVFCLTKKRTRQLNPSNLPRVVCGVFGARPHKTL